nr:immunoglobulin heavy chain junction region [Macaca mulatta]MOV39739.1 immunoglobulin heavy chain junction region [Macaca mulatta]MOV42730.1 immunoglobulin heavy chain junction region [Macaca mulatta]MOV44888.1 immunoglobulin heavy chain junction region [Macaca mulatta]MOV45545.1 immunoglobulin heavy chain junction region [Macaca mulatta]
CARGPYRSIRGAYFDNW